jgi:hypothetical protein
VSPGRVGNRERRERRRKKSKEGGCIPDDRLGIKSVIPFRLKEEGGHLLVIREAARLYHHGNVYEGDEVYVLNS